MTVHHEAVDNGIGDLLEQVGTEDMNESCQMPLNIRQAWKYHIPHTLNSTIKHVASPSWREVQQMPEPS